MIPAVNGGIAGVRALRARKGGTEMKITKCRSCGADIVWLVTQRNKMIPVDADSIADKEAEVFDPEQMTTHFATCRDADKWRKKRKINKDE